MKIIIDDGKDDDDFTRRKFRWAATGKQANQFARKFFLFIVGGTILSVFALDRKKTIHGKSSIMLMAKVSVGSGGKKQALKGKGKQERVNFGFEGENCSTV